MPYFCSNCGASMINLQSCAACTPSFHPPLEPQRPFDLPLERRPQGFPNTLAVASYNGVGTAAGTQSTHAYAGRDAIILDRVEAASMVLEQVAKEMRDFAASDTETRNLIRQCVSMAADLANEVDRRKGKQL